MLDDASPYDRDVDDDVYLDIDAIDPLAVGAYLGDFYVLGYLSTQIFATCVIYLVNNFQSPFHLRCVEVILERAYCYPAPLQEPRYLFESLGIVRKRAHQLFGKEISPVSLKSLFCWVLLNVDFLSRRRIPSPILFVVSCLTSIRQKATLNLQYLRLKSNSPTCVQSLRRTTLTNFMNVQIQIVRARQNPKTHPRLNLLFDNPCFPIRLKAVIEIENPVGQVVYPHVILISTIELNLNFENAK